MAIDIQSVIKELELPFRQPYFCCRSLRGVGAGHACAIASAPAFLFFLRFRAAQE
jgi:hypothetical protein